MRRRWRSSSTPSLASSWHGSRSRNRSGTISSFLAPETSGHYASGFEDLRLSEGYGRLEFLRTQDITLRHLKEAPAVVLDVGGGTGPYALWLADLGYEVHLVDAMPLHIDIARKKSEEARSSLASVEVGDARSLQWQDATVDAVLLMGPLYHLTARADRLRALAEVRRVLRPGGMMFAAGVSRFASTLDGLLKGYHANPGFRQIVKQDLKDGQHRNPENNPAYFTTAFFHHPSELRNEVEATGFECEPVLGVEGPAWLLGNLDGYLSDKTRTKLLLDALRPIEAESSLAGVSAHIMAVGRRPA